MWATGQARSGLGLAWPMALKELKGSKYKKKYKGCIAMSIFSLGNFQISTEASHNCVRFQFLLLLPYFYSSTIISLSSLT